MFLSDKMQEGISVNQPLCDVTHLSEHLLTSFDWLSAAVTSQGAPNVNKSHWQVNLLAERRVSTTRRCSDRCVWLVGRRGLPWWHLMWRLTGLSPNLIRSTVCKFKKFPPRKLIFVNIVGKFQILEYRKVAILPKGTVTMLIWPPTWNT